MRKLFNYLKNWIFRNNEYPHNSIKVKVDTEIIKTRIFNMGFKLTEIPVRKSHPEESQRTVVSWKIIATKGHKSFVIVAPELTDALEKLGKSLGVIANN